MAKSQLAAWALLALGMALPATAKLTGSNFSVVSHVVTAAGAVSSNSVWTLTSSLPMSFSGAGASANGYAVYSGHPSQSVVKFAATGVETAHAYPVPWRQRQHFQRPITFTGLPAVAKIKIYTLAGELVRELDKDNPGAELPWDLRNDVGQEIASGVYHFWVRDQSTGEWRAGKLMVIR